MSIIVLGTISHNYNREVQSESGFTCVGMGDTRRASDRIHTTYVWACARMWVCAWGIAGVGVRVSVRVRG